MDIPFSMEIPYCMGTSLSTSEIFLTKLILYTLFLLGFAQELVYRLFSYLGFTDFIEPDVARSNSPAHQSKFNSLTAELIKETLPLVRFKDLQVDGTLNGCVVCFDEFEGGEEIRWLANCPHIFHQKCLDCWIDYGRKTCPMCRTPLIVTEMEKAFKPLASDC